MRRFLTKSVMRGLFPAVSKRDTPRLLAAKKGNCGFNRATRCACAAVSRLQGRNGRLVRRPQSGHTCRCRFSGAGLAEDWKIRIYERLDRLMLRRMERVVCVSHGQADKAKRAGVRPERIEVIHNAINTSRFSNPDPACREKTAKSFSRHPYVPTSKFVIGAAGRLSPEKGFELLIEAAQAVSRKHPEVGFVLFGEGVLREPLQSQIDSSSLNDHFQLAGYTDELDQFMPCLDLFVQSSYTEGLPNVLLEAAAAGVADCCHQGWRNPRSSPARRPLSFVRTWSQRPTCRLHIGN